MSNILKFFTNPGVKTYQYIPADAVGEKAQDYVFASLTDDDEEEYEDDETDEEPEDMPEEPKTQMSTPGAAPAAPSAPPQPDPIAFQKELAAREVEQMLKDARAEAASILEQARSTTAAAAEKAKQEGEKLAAELRKRAVEDGYQKGYEQGLAEAKAKSEKEWVEEHKKLAEDAERRIDEFLRSAEVKRQELYEKNRDELKELALTVAEKVVRVSLKSSGEVIARMIQAATEKMTRREWVHIYIGDSGVKNALEEDSELTAALAGLSDYVKIVPLSDDELGTCIIETPDAIIDASASTQLENIREMLQDEKL